LKPHLGEWEVPGSAETRDEGPPSRIAAPARRRALAVGTATGHISSTVDSVVTKGRQMRTKMPRHLASMIYPYVFRRCLLHSHIVCLTRACPCRLRQGKTLLPNHILTARTVILSGDSGYLTTSSRPADRHLHWCRARDHSGAHGSQPAVPALADSRDLIGDVQRESASTAVRGPWACAGPAIPACCVRFDSTRADARTRARRTP
jgi:hypothetical protein